MPTHDMLYRLCRSFSTIEPTGIHKFVYTNRFIVGLFWYIVGLFRYIIGLFCNM